jgi:hypothetical protein
MATDQVQVTSADIARIAGVKPTAVSNWRRRHDDFPKPVGGTDRSPRFDLALVESWLRRQGRTEAISAGQRLWQAFDSVRGVVSPEDALSAVGMLLLHLRQHSDTTVPTEPAALARLMAQAERTFAGVTPAGAGPVDHLSRVDIVRLTILLTTAGDATHSGGASTEAEIFELLCSRFLDTAGRAGFTATPPELADLMVRLAGAPAGTLLDLACGSGTILLTAATHGYQRVLGQELNPSIARLAALRLAFRNAGEHPVTFDVQAGDSLRRPVFAHEHAAAVVSNPPFADRNWGYDELAHSSTWEYGVPTRMESELAWVQQALAQVVPGGAVVMLMPPGVAFRPSGRRIRRELLTRGALRAVISLPPGLAAHYSLALQIWILRHPEGQVTPTNLLVVDITGEATSPKPTVWAQVSEVVTESWGKFCADPDGFPDRSGIARAVPLDDLLNEQVDLTPRRHLPLPPPPGVSGHELSAAREQFTRLLSVVGDTLPGSTQLPDLGQESTRAVALNELAKTGAVFVRRVPASSVTVTGDDARSVPTIEGRILTSADIATGQPPSRVGDVDSDEVRNPPIRPGDVLVPVVARQLNARVAVDEDIGAYPASTVYVVRTDPAVLDPWFLAGYLSSSDGGRQAERVGSSLGGDIRIDLRRVRVPLVPIDTQRAYGQVFKRLSEFTRNLRAAHDLGLELARNSTDAITSGLTRAADVSPSTHP